jgi:XRE family transcriptional regulator, regulator of sulfur utilization
VARASIVCSMIESQRTRREVGKRITTLRQSKGVTLTGLARASHLDTSHLWRIEHGTGTTTLEGFQRIASALGVEWTALFGAPRCAA